MENQKNETLMYLEIWNTETKNNDKAKTESFEKSQQDKEVLKKQYEKDINELEIENPNCPRKLFVKCMNDNKHRK